MNWAVIAPMIIYLVIIFIIGFYSQRTMQKSSSFMHEYFLGSRSLGGFVLAMTLVTTYGSASSFIGGPGTAYTMGLGWALLAMTQLPAGYFTLSVLGKKFAIMSRKINAVTLTDFLKERYQSKWVVILSAVSMIIFLFALMAAQWVGGGRLIEAATGIPYTTALFIFAMVVIVYVVIGGFRAVVITDSIQGVVMLIGTVLIVVSTIIAGGGIPNIIADLTAENPNLIRPFGADGSLTPLYVSTFWILTGVGVVGLPQIAVRAMSYKNSKAMHRAIMIGTFVVGFIMLGFHLAGVFGRVIIPDLDVGDKIMPLLSMEVMPPWLAGITLAAPMAAIMSTVDSILLLVSSSLVKDLYINYVKPTASESTAKRMSFWSTAIIGILVFIMAVNPPDLLIWLNLFAIGGLEAAFIWPIVLGLYWKGGNKYGALTSIIVGVVSYILIDQLIPDLFGVHQVTLPIILALVGFVVASLLTRKQMADQQREIISRLWSA